MKPRIVLVVFVLVSAIQGHTAPAIIPPTPTVQGQIVQQTSGTPIRKVNIGANARIFSRELLQTSAAILDCVGWLRASTKS